MKKNRFFKFIILTFSFLICCSFSSCKVFLSLTQNQNGDVYVEFSGIPEEAFINTIKSFLANDSESTTNKNLIIDTAQINSFLINSGFTNVEVSNQIGANVDIKMTIPKDKTFIFDSKLVFSDNSGVNSNFGIELSPATLQTFYANADEQIISILDILISPAFYGEEISEEEYIETIASLYGNDVAEEMNKSEIYITLKNKSGKVVKKSLPLKTLLTLKQSVKIGW
jgi:hypothetical protein